MILVNLNQLLEHQITLALCRSIVCPSELRKNHDNILSNLCFNVHHNLLLYLHCTQITCLHTSFCLPWRLEFIRAEIISVISYKIHVGVFNIYCEFRLFWNIFFSLTNKFLRPFSPFFMSFFSVFPFPHFFPYIFIFNFFHSGKTELPEFYSQRPWPSWLFVAGYPSCQPTQIDAPNIDIQIIA